MREKRAHRGGGECYVCGVGARRDGRNRGAFERALKRIKGGQVVR